MPYSAKTFFEINEDIVQILLMLKVLFTQDSKVEDLFCGASGSEPSLFFSNYFFSLGLKPTQDDFQHDFAQMTDEADSSVVLAELQVALFMPRHKKVAGYYVIPSELLSVCPSVRPSVHPSAVEHSCPVHNFDTVRDNFTKLGTNVKHNQTTCRD